MRASIVIPAYNAERTIAATIKACLSQDFPDDEYEVIVVDDGSSDRTGEKVRDYPVEYITQKNAGAAAARNAGMDAAHGAYVVFVDSDCVLPEDALRKLIETLEDDPQLGIVGGIYAPTSNGPLVPATIYEEIRYRHLHSPSQVKHIGSFCMAMRQRLLEDVGGFDAQFRRGQDNELSNRVSNAGYNLRVLKNVEIAHDHPRTLWSWLKNQYYQAYWRVESVLRHSKVLKSDGYVDHRDWVSLLVGAATIALLPFIWLSWVKWIIVSCIAASALLQVPVAVFAIRDTGDWRQAIIVPMQVIRGWVWAVGAAVGVVSALYAKQAKPNEGETISQNVQKKTK